MHEQVKSDKCVVLTGGKGFIGGAVAEELERRNINYVILDRNSGDVRTFDSYFCVAESAGFEIGHVIHLAGVLGTHELFDTPFEAVDVNVNGTLTALEVCRRSNAGFTGITMPQVFPSIYTATKIGSTALAKAYNHTHGVPVSHVRAFNAFGPRQAHGAHHPQKIIPTFAYNAWNGLDLPIWGSGSQTVDLIHTKDLGRMLVDAMSFGNDDVFDGGTGQAFTVKEVAQMVLDYVSAQRDTTSNLEFLPMRRGEIETDIVATGEGWDRLGWSPQFSFDELFDTVDWYENYEAH